MSAIDTKIDLIRQYLDVRVASHGIHSSNIANAETPHYLAKIPTFEASLDRAKSLDNPLDHKWKFDMRIDKSAATPREDGNNVQLDSEMSKMAENSLMYMSAIQILNKEMAITKYAISAGR